MADFNGLRKYLQDVEDTAGVVDMKKHDAQFHGGHFDQKTMTCELRDADKADEIGGGDANGDPNERTTRLAPNGKRSNLTNRQYDQVRTKAFKKWFGDWENDPEHASKVVDENGEPLVVYHGNLYGDKFTKFNTTHQWSEAPENTFWFVDNQETAKGYMRYAVDKTPMAVFLDIKDPLDYDAEGVGFKKSGVNALVSNERDAGESDGVICRNIKDSYDVEDTPLATDYICFSPKQIKSATDNSGKFSRRNSDINDEAVGKVRKYLEMAQDEDNGPKNETLAEHRKHCEAEPGNCPFEKKLDNSDDLTIESSSSNSYQGMKTPKSEVRRIVGNFLYDFAENFGIRVVDFEIHGSRGRGTARQDSDLDVVFEYDDGEGEEITTQEDDVFNEISRKPLKIDGIQVDFNPINADDSGTLEDYMARDKEYDEVKKRDAAYMDAVKRGDMETVQRMVREAAAKAMPNVILDDDGQPKIWYHATDETFTKFDPSRVGTKHGHDSEGYFFLDNRAYAEGFYSESGNSIECFISSQNPKTEETDDNAIHLWDSIGGIYRGKNDVVIVNGFTQNAENNGDYSEEEWEEELEQREPMTMAVVFSSNQIKSANPVTYDDACNVIPLSKRFDMTNPDIRY